ncbi:Cytochrome P450 4c3 [Eumeta japonica]|uniref:Cytochrome P450 4c3 n=1 Tax=Eumeta variegata TaxID=151549 RepID=A0A4C1WU29_EUMVA|nr:Cytochrome P450 4c3 [Eumeta japonica]
MKPVLGCQYAQAYGVCPIRKLKAPETWFYPAGSPKAFTASLEAAIRHMEVLTARKVFWHPFRLSRRHNAKFEKRISMCNKDGVRIENEMDTMQLNSITTSGVTNPEDAEVVLNTCLEKDYIYRFGYPWVGKGLITADANALTPLIRFIVPTWRRHHKLLSPAFNQNVLNGFMGVFNRQSSVMVEAMAKELGRERFDASVYIGAATLEMICRTCTFILTQFWS